MGLNVVLFKTWIFYWLVSAQNLHDGIKAVVAVAGTNSYLTFHCGIETGSNSVVA